MRRRGKARNWYIRGTVVYGDRIAQVPEFCSGTSDKPAASHLMAEREREIREALIFGPRVVLTRSVIADAFEAYLTKPKSPNSTDVVRIGVMNERIGAMSLSDPKAAWHAFREEYLTRHAPAGQDRYRSLLQAAVNVYNERHDLPPFKLKAIPFDNQRIRFLSHADRDRLIESYSKHVQPIATMFAFQGPRTQEALQPPWGEGAWTWAAARSSSPAPRPAIRARSRSTLGSMPCCVRSGSSAVSLKRGMCSSTGAASPIPIRAT
jgi:hypothetical protein